VAGGAAIDGGATKPAGVLSTGTDTRKVFASMLIIVSSVDMK
jgi:hypothetical protein